MTWEVQRGEKQQQKMTWRSCVLQRVRRTVHTISDGIFMGRVFSSKKYTYIQVRGRVHVKRQREREIKERNAKKPPCCVYHAKVVLLCTRSSSHDPQRVSNTIKYDIIYIFYKRLCWRVQRARNPASSYARQGKGRIILYRIGSAPCILRRCTIIYRYT